MPIPFRLPRFYPVLDTALLANRECPVQLAAEALLDAGVKILQYRHKHDWTQRHFDEAQKIALLCQDRGVLFVVNDRADFARLIGAALHIGQDDLPPVAARRILSDEVIGFSTHNQRQLLRAEEEPVEYIAFGPIFATHSKINPDPVVGTEGLERMRALTKKPLAAIGGITLENASAVLNAGADSVAVISGVLPDRSDRNTLRKLAAEWLRVTGVPARQQSSSGSA
jgi:thiamine-phosphate pyrophosphorylase